MRPLLNPFDIIAADPPWRYKFSKSKSRAIKYLTMPTDEIARIPVADFAHPDSICFLWVPPPKLKEGLLVLERWGFQYVTGAVWDKKRIGPGYYVRNRHEHLLIGKRGEPELADPSSRVSSVLEEPRRAHSQKPDVFYTAMDAMFPASTFRRLELFAVSRHPGWTCWGLSLGWELGPWGVCKVTPQPHIPGMSAVPFEQP